MSLDTQGIGESGGEGDNLLLQLEVFENRFNELLENPVWVKKDRQQVKSNFQSRYSEIRKDNPINGNPEDYRKRHNLMNILLLDMLAYIDYFIKGPLGSQVQPEGEETDYSSVADKYIKSTNSTLELKGLQSPLHQDLVTAFRSSGQKPPAREIQSIVETVRCTIGEIQS